MEVTHKKVTRSLSIEEFVFATCFVVIGALCVLRSDKCTQNCRISRKVMGMVEFQNTGFHATVRRFKEQVVALTKQHFCLLHQS